MLLQNIYMSQGMEFAKKRLYQKFVMEVTVRHLLEHTAGIVFEKYSLFTAEITFCKEKCLIKSDSLIYL